VTYIYSRWDGTQGTFESDATDVLAHLNDDLLYHGDLGAALRRLLQSGFDDRNGRRVNGLREMLERLRQRRRDELDRWDLGGVHEDIARALREVIDTEQASLERLDDAAASSADPARQAATNLLTNERRAQLDAVPPDLAGRIRALRQYEFTSTEARERFETLLDDLRAQIMKSQFNQMAGALAQHTPESLERQRQMFDALNRMLEQRAEGLPLDPGFDAFMESFGDMFPGRPADLDELLRAFAAQMAAAASMLASLTPEQRAELAELTNQMLADMDLRWQVERLAANLRGALPQAGWDSQRAFRGVDPLSLAEAAGVMGTLSDIDELENLLTTAQAPGALADVDLDKARQLLGDADAASLERLAHLTAMLEEAGLIAQREGRLALTPRGMRRIGENALAQVFSKLTRDRIGDHALDRPGLGHQREHTTKAYEWGDPFNLSIERTLHRALQRGAGIPIRLQPEDFEVERTETTTRSSTVLAIDCSMSMPMRDRFLAAKRVAVALQSLIASRYPRDYLGLVAFSEVARELKASELPELSWDFVYGTNMEHALILARRMLAHQGGAKQVVMITDGEPTAHLLPGGSVTFDYPPSAETIEATLAQVARCTRDGIRINTFMLEASAYLRAFVERMTALNGGRAFFTTPQNLGDYVLVDFLDHKRSLHGL
jgi:uncharacterized protein with von Willebrand factor type A (vWA) domain